MEAQNQIWCPNAAGPSQKALDHEAAEGVVFGASGQKSLWLLHEKESKRKIVTSVGQHGTGQGSQCSFREEPMT